MSRIKRYKHDRKKAIKLEKLALLGLAAVTVCLAGASLAQAEETVAETPKTLVDTPESRKRSKQQKRIRTLLRKLLIKYQIKKRRQLRERNPLCKQFLLMWLKYITISKLVVEGKLNCPEKLSLSSQEKATP